MSRNVACTEDPQELVSCGESGALAEVSIAVSCD